MIYREDIFVIPQLPPKLGYDIIKLAGGFVRNLMIEI